MGFFSGQGLLAAGEQLLVRCLKKKPRNHDAHAKAGCLGHSTTKANEGGWSSRLHASIISTMKCVVTLGVLHVTACWAFYGALEHRQLVSATRYGMCNSMPPAWAVAVGLAC